ncbi:MAG: chitobiase/beta-hexosaminidase C-terminal domain-containing protein, partial [Spirochaetales bacterium]|nr:chitobiase/beta-hexosaminidase C-terminal domain-containing protein [Spirochaetales bacterium]
MNKSTFFLFQKYMTGKYSGVLITVIIIACMFLSGACRVSDPTPTEDTDPPTLTVTYPTNGEKTSQATITFTGTFSDASAVELSYSVDNGSFTVFGTSSPWSVDITFANGAHTVVIRAQDAEDNYTDVSVSFEVDLVPPAPPVISPAAGVYTLPQTVTISAEDGAIVYYTLDGSVPTTLSTIYTAAIIVSAETSVRAIAVDEVENSSTVAESWYITSAYVPPAPTNLQLAFLTISTAEISWNAAASAASYRVFRADSAIGPYTEAASGVSATSWEDTGLGVDEEHYYKVSAVCLNGETAQSDYLYVDMSPN